MQSAPRTVLSRPKARNRTFRTRETIRHHHRSRPKSLLSSISRWGMMPAILARRSSMGPRPDRAMPSRSRASMAVFAGISPVAHLLVSGAGAIWPWPERRRLGGVDVVGYAVALDRARRGPMPPDRRPGLRRAARRAPRVGARRGPRSRARRGGRPPGRRHVRRPSDSRGRRGARPPSARGSQERIAGARRPRGHPPARAACLR